MKLGLSRPWVAQVQSSNRKLRVYWAWATPSARPGHAMSARAMMTNVPPTILGAFDSPSRLFMRISFSMCASAAIGQTRGALRSRMTP